ncbi:hypothetical protein KP79_PYT23065 [Mizuhopecten yessoensis]|uniref:Myb-like domain-containing protein n=1 Tax=Mizuhopecten yessoensis TaxID=6573 RepID=A0A210PQ72_MIZYE|nr:hypothetical protein KP79_PYT23065 [Mizuhopecten yessoensis]
MVLMTEQDEDDLNRTQGENRNTMFECEECRKWFSEMHLFIAHESISVGSAESLVDVVPPNTAESNISSGSSGASASSGTSDANSSADAGTCMTTTVWTRAATLLLIDEYKSRMRLLTTGKLRKKSAWVQISKVLCSHGHNMTPSQCEGKWKTLLRGPKNVNDHNNKSGNDSKSHPYANEFAFISNKPNFNPLYVACSDSSANKQSTETSDSDGEKPVKSSKISPIKGKRSSDGSEPKPKQRKSHASEVINVLSNFISNQQERYENESARKEQMHSERMEIFRGFLSAAKSRGIGAVHNNQSG